MFQITYENGSYNRWACEYIFKDIKDTKNYLRSDGFIENNRLFERWEYNWSSFIRAYINPVKVYSMKS